MNFYPMSFSISPPIPNYPYSINLPPHKNKNKIIQFQRSVIARCESKSSWINESGENNKIKLGIGSPVVIIDAPQLIKSAASVPCLRVNDGLVKPGDVGRIVSRKPKDVWAVRLSIGTYLIDGKYFQPLDIQE